MLMRARLEVNRLEQRENPGNGHGAVVTPPTHPPGGGPPPEPPSLTVVLPPTANEAAAGEHGAVTLEIA
jgi:hypothetical protein